MVAWPFLRPPPHPDRRKQFFRHGSQTRKGRGLLHRYRRTAPAGKDAFVEPVELPQDPFHAVSRRGPSRPLPDGDADFPDISPEVIAINVEMQGGSAFPLADHFPELPVGAEPFFPGKPEILPRRALPGRQGHFLPLTVTERRFRPFARRREMTALPAGVDIRLRNPWVRFRRRLCG